MSQLQRTGRLPLHRAALWVAALGLGPGASLAADACKVRDSSAAVALLLCPAGASQDAWRQAGAAACKGKAPCNAWIWDEASKMPAKAPRTDAEMAKSATGAARAVWLGDSQVLMLIGKPR